MERGLLPAVISISRKFMPVSRRLLTNTIDSLGNVFQATLSDDSEQRASEEALGSKTGGDVEMVETCSGNSAFPDKDSLRHRTS